MNKYCGISFLIKHTFYSSIFIRFPSCQQAKKTAKQSKQFNQKAEISSSDGCQSKESAAGDEGNATAAPEDGTPGRTEGPLQQSLSKQKRAAAKGEPLEGSSTKTQARARSVVSLYAH